MASSIGEYEITKHELPVQWFPLQLIVLRETGSCTVSLPEELFDLDCPGHIFRRIKSVALTIPCVTGPYASVNCSLTLQTSMVRDDPSATVGNTAWRRGRVGRHELSAER